MKSQARIEAGRRNGLLAKGKKSQEARQKCAQNGKRGDHLVAAPSGNRNYSKPVKSPHAHYVRRYWQTGALAYLWGSRRVGICASLQSQS